MRIGIYARRSIESDKSSSIQMQISTCRKQIELLFDESEIDHVEVYEDEGFTRRNTDRPDWQRMMRDIEDGLIDVIVAYKVDRVSGNMKDFANFYHKIVHDLELRLICCKDNIDSKASLTGEIMAYISALMASYEVQQDSIRSYDNAKNLAVHGLHVGGPPPIGYRAVPVVIDGKSHKMLEIDEEAVEWKMNLVNMFLDNKMSLTSMETYLRKKQIRTLKGAFFSSTQLHKLLTSAQCVEATPEMYDYFESLGCEMNSPREQWDGSTGITVFGKTTEQKGKHQLNPPNKWVISLGLHKPYMKAETFFAIQDRLKSNLFNKKTKFPKPLLRGVLRCKCGRLMQVQRKHNKDGTYNEYYYCMDRYRSGKCDMSQLNVKLLDNKVIQILNEIEADPMTIKKYSRYDSSFEVSKYNSLKSKENKISQKIQSLVKTLAENESSAAKKYIIDELERLDQELSNIKKELIVATSERNRAIALSRDSRDKHKEIANFVENFESFSKEDRNLIVTGLLSECVWDGEMLKITI